MKKMDDKEFFEGADKVTETLNAEFERRNMRIRYVPLEFVQEMPVNQEVSLL
ncbi:hypothetical protein MsAc7_03240 [Methanolapillus millepedarum]|uniref:Uncharacterized protein n=2 Tax=Methanolapillus millepedarum TaxID=3028296 RepID=A0AA96ZTS4_9EURY|nr:hypothetical protein MsAc7_03240 [Methanosarcinaceae archaeon Ac7]